MDKPEAQREPWLIWWYRNAFQPFAAPAEITRRLSIALKVGGLAIGLWLISPSFRPAPIHLLLALGGGCAGLLYFYALRSALWRGDRKVRLTPWVSLGEGATEKWWASSMLAITFLAYAAFEETLWRYVIQQHLLSGTPIAVAVVAVVFCAEHFIWEGNVSLPQILDFLGFAALLGVWVFISGSVVPAIFMHWTRNLCILRCYEGS